MSGYDPDTARRDWQHGVLARVDQEDRMIGIAREWTQHAPGPSSSFPALVHFAAHGMVFPELRQEVATCLAASDVDVHGEEAIDDLTELFDYVCDRTPSAYT